MVSVPVAVALGRLEEFLAFGLGQILAFAGNCPVFAVGACLFWRMFSWKTDSLPSANSRRWGAW
jgi:hypothetical protein